MTQPNDADRLLTDEEILPFTGHISVEAMNYWNKADVYRAIAKDNAPCCT